MARAQTWVGVTGPELMQHCVEHYRQVVSQSRQIERIQVVVRSHRQAQAFREQVQAVELSGSGSLHIDDLLGFVGRQLRTYWGEVRAAYPQVPPLLDPQVLPKDLTQFLLARTCQSCPQHTTVFQNSGLPDYQIWDQISSAAYIAGASGLDPSEIGPRLIEAWPDPGDTAKLACFEAVSCCVQQLRQAALACGSLDFGTQIALFEQVILPLPQFWQSFDHLIVDQVEDSNGVGLHFYQLAVQRLASVRFSLTVAGGGTLTGIPDLIEDFCQTQTELVWVPPQGSLPLMQVGQRLYQQLTAAAVSSPLDLDCPALDCPGPDCPDPDCPDPEWLNSCLGKLLALSAASSEPAGDPWGSVELDWIEADTQIEAAEAMVERIHLLLDAGTDPTDIVILAPRIEPPLLQIAATHLANLPVAILSPFPALVKYPLVRALLTLLEVVHQSRIPTLSEVEVVLGSVLLLDPIRAQLLARDIYFFDRHDFNNADAVSEPERVGFVVLERYQALVDWIRTQQRDPEPSLPTLINQCAQQHLTTQLYQPQTQLLLKNLMETAQRFERALPHLSATAFVTMIQSGQTPARSLFEPDYQGYLVIATPIDYLNQELRAAHQFWFDISSGAWSRSLWRSLYNAEVLTPNWNGAVFDEPQDRQSRRRRLAKTLLNLCCHATHGIHWVRASYDLRGRDQLGDLDRLIRRALQSDRLSHALDPGA
ncbi:MAG: hypothetical protein HC924_05430 [Synechococcaceae cyanobacterium SM2_3_2]|nr:hypothetical protein [Synechococcaceae cyanobacterium SM2_3_2]